MVVINGVEMVDVREAARLVGRTPETVRRWVWSHRVSSLKHGTKLMLPRSELLALVGETGGGTVGVTLRDWAERVRRTHSGRPGGSARDLVLDDRAARDQDDLRAGR